MNNDQLISIDDDSLDMVAGGGFTLTASITLPTPGEVIEEGVEAVEGVAGAVAEGIGGLLGLFGFGISIK